MHKIKFQGKFFKSLNFRIMLFLLLMGTVPALIIGGVFLMSYERQAMAQLSNDVKNQCQILSTQLRDGENLLKTEDEVLQGELTQLASLYDGRIIIIDQNFQIIEDTSQLEEGRTMVAEEVVRCFKGENTSHYGKQGYQDRDRRDPGKRFYRCDPCADGGIDGFCTDVDRSSDHLCAGTLDHSCQLAGASAAAYEPVYRRTGRRIIGWGSGYS